LQSNNKNGKNVIFLKNCLKIKVCLIVRKIRYIPFDRSFLQLSNGIRHFMPSTDRKLELKAKDIDGSYRLTAGCVLTDLASPAVSRTAVYANGLIQLGRISTGKFEY
jgi:hypothetical protein